jgi:beta-lactamase regulating signal transducer with metallopeptidase domain
MFEWLLLHTAVTALLAVVVCVLIRLFRPGPAASHALWLVVLLKLLTPPLVVWPWSLPSWTEAPPPPRTPPEQPVRVVAAEPFVAVGEEIAEPVDIPLAGSLRAETTVPPAAALPRFSLSAWLPGLSAAAWLAGGLTIMWRQARRLERLRRLVALTGTPPDALAGVVRAAAARQGVRPPVIAVVPGLASPAVWGLRRTWLLWPQGLEESLSTEGLHAVVAHELAHLRRRDHWVGWLLLLGECVWWWHPLFRLVRRRLGREAEQACDARAVEEAPESRREYAEALVAVVERMTRPAALPVLGAASDRHEVERRIIMILNGTKTGSARRWLLAAGLLAVLALPAWTLGRQQEKERKEPVREPELVEPTPADEKKESKVREEQAPRHAAVRDRVAELMAKYNALYKQGKYAEAAHVAVQAMELDPDNPVLIIAASVASRQAASRPVDPLLVPTAPPVAPPAPPVAVGLPTTGPPSAPETIYYEPVTTMRDGRPVTFYRLRHLAPPRDEIRLSRVTYRLPADKAKAMAALLTDVKATVMEIRVDGEKLIVTTTPEAQETVAQLVRLLSVPMADSAPPRHAPPEHAVPPADSAPMPPRTTPVPAPAHVPGGSGKIQSIDEKSGLVLLEIGSDAGLKAGDTVQLCRRTPEPKYLGTLEIIQVTPSGAVAKPKGTMKEKPQFGDWWIDPRP